MDVSRREAVVWIGLSAAGAAGPHAAAGDVVAPNVDRYRVVEPVFEGVRVILAKRGERHSPAYVQGISGAAFRIAGPCPCAPTCSMAMEPHELVRLLGYAPEPLPPPAAGADERAWMNGALARVKAEVRAGRPVLMFHAFTSAEWDVVCGFNEVARQLIGRGSTAGLRSYARADEARTLRSRPICGVVMGPVLIGQKTGAFDARAAETAALREAVRFARDMAAAVPYPGVQCYDRWIALVREDHAPKPDFPRDGYTSSIYRSTQGAAAAFLREIAPGRPEIAGPLRTAAGSFAHEARALGAFHDLLFTPNRTAATAATDRERSELAARLLTQARDAYQRGIDEIARALPQT